jgi:hypothetical protein
LQNPYASNPLSNPYAASELSDPSLVDSGEIKQLTVVATVLLTMAMLTLAMCIVGLGFNLALGLGFAPPPNLDGPARIGYSVGQIGGIVVQIVCQCVAILGAVAMIRRRHIAHAWAGAICSLVPICGPCIGLSIPFGIWAMVLLRRPSVRAAFD